MRAHTRFVFFLAVVTIFNLTAQILSALFHTKQVTAFNIPIAFSIESERGEREQQQNSINNNHFTTFIGTSAIVVVVIFSLLSHFNRNGFYVFAPEKKEHPKNLSNLSKDKFVYFY